MTKEEMIRVLADELESALNRMSTADNGNIQNALAFYDGTLPANDNEENPDDENRAAVSLDVADMTEAVYAQMQPAFEDIGAIEFEPINEQDEPQAKLESEIVRSMLIDGRGADGAFVAMAEGIKNCLLTRKCVLALWVDNRETRTPERYENVPTLALADIQMPKAEGQRIEHVEIEETGKTEDGAQHVYTVSFDRVDVEKRLAVACVAPENFITSSLEDRDPNRARFCADRIVTTRSELVAQGFKESEVAALPSCDPATYDLYIRRAANDPMRDAAQRATAYVEIWRCYIELAKGKDSAAAERYRVHYSKDGKRLLGEPVKVGRVCYAIGNVIIYPHRMDGVSLYDRLGEIQALKTKALRNWIENLHTIARPRLGVDESLANLDDARDATQPIIRIKGADALVPVPVVDAGASVSMFLQYQDQARSERGGASLDMQTAAMQVTANQTAQGIERQYSTKEQLAATMARTFAETCLRSMYQIAHYLLRTQWGGTISAKLAGKWVQVDPSTWRARNGVMVRVGQSQSDRMRKQMALQGVIAQQQAWLQAGYGGILVDESRLFNAAHDWIAASQLRMPDRYLIDPQSEAAQQAKQARDQAAQQAQQQQAALQRAMLMLEKYKEDMRALTSTISDIVKASIEEAKLTLQPDPLQGAQLMAGQVGAAAASDAERAESAMGAGDGANQ